jgi:hypothetical protein
LRQDAAVIRVSDTDQHNTSTMASECGDGAETSGSGCDRGGTSCQGCVASPRLTPAKQLSSRVGRDTGIIGQGGFRCKTGIPAGVRDRIGGVPQPLPAAGVTRGKAAAPVPAGWHAQASLERRAGMLRLATAARTRCAQHGRAAPACRQAGLAMPPARPHRLTVPHVVPFSRRTAGRGAGADEAQGDLAGAAAGLRRRAAADADGRGPAGQERAGPLRHDPGRGSSNARWTGSRTSVSNGSRAWRSPARPSSERNSRPRSGRARPPRGPVAPWS